MSLTYGFYNGVLVDGSTSEYDRSYDASDFSGIFDGIINDGIFASIGTAMVVEADSGTIVNVGIGRAWFNSTWTLNTAIYPITLDDAEAVLDRIDAVVLEVDSSSRTNSFKVVKGTPASSPVNPTLTDSDDVHQHALAYIYRTGGSASVTQSNITNAVGTDETPFVTGILSVISLDEVMGQWQDELNTFISDGQADIEAFVSTAQTSLNNFVTENQADFDDWFSNLKTQLDGDVAANLQTEIETKQSWHVTASVVISASEWDSSTKTCTKTVTGVTETNSIIVGSSVASADDYSKARIRAISQTDNEIVFECKTVPKDEITLNVMILEEK